MASRFLLHARVGASVAARSVRGHGGQILTPSTAYPTLMADAGSFARTITATQGLRHYGTPSNNRNVAELNEAPKWAERRLDALEEKCDVGHKASMKDIFKKYKPGHKDIGGVDITNEFRQMTNGVMIVGFGLTLGLAVYYHFL